MHSGVKSSTTLEKDAYKDAEVIRAGTFGEKSSTTLEPDHYKDAAGDTRKRDEGALSGQKTTDYDT